MLPTFSMMKAPCSIPNKVMTKTSNVALTIHSFCVKHLRSILTTKPQTLTKKTALATTAILIK